MEIADCKLNRSHKKFMDYQNDFSQNTEIFSFHNLNFIHTNRRPTEESKKNIIKLFIKCFFVLSLWSLPEC